MQADWPINALQRLLAYHVLVCHGRYGEISALDYGHRVPAGGTVDGRSNSVLRFFAIGKPSHYPAQGQLASGKFDFLHVAGITEGERDFAKSTSTAELISLLSLHGAFPVTKPSRAQIPL
jgi:hypothetical protein